MQVVKALSNPTRIRIVDAMVTQPASPAELAGTLDERLSLISYHVGILRTTGCIQATKEQKKKGAAERTYELAPAAESTRFVVMPDWSKSGSPHPPAALVRSVINKGNPDFDPSATGGRRRHQLSCASIVVDRQGWMEISAALGEVLDRVSAAYEGAAARLAESEEEGITATFAIASFESGPGETG